MKKESVNFKTVKGKRYSGRIIWHIDEYKNDPDGPFNDCITFYCGAETIEGYLDDSDTAIVDIEKVLGSLFSDHMIDIGLSESFHAVFMNEGESPDELYKIMKERLESTNGVMKEIN